MINHVGLSSRLVAIAVGAALLSGPAMSQDEGLYPEAPAADASFIRVYVPGDETVAINDATLQPSEGGLTPYIEIAPGPVVLSINGEEHSVEAAPNTHYSYIYNVDSEGVLLTDNITGSPAQADLVFYNLSDIESADLFVPSANAVAVQEVAPGAASAVALRAPLTLDVEIRSGEETVAQVAGVELVRSASTTVLLEGQPGAYQAHSEINTYAD